MSAFPLVERVPIHNNLKRLAETTILVLLLSLLAYRLASLHSHGFLWFSAFICESWFTFSWLLTMNLKWTPVAYKTYPENLSKRYDDLPAVDMFVTTADPKLEPPIVTVNTVLSMLAVEYPAEKLACYVSDDGCSAITYCSLVEASKFAKLWVPFCKKYNVTVRAPSVYFSDDTTMNVLESSTAEFMEDWTHAKSEYNELCERIKSLSSNHNFLTLYHDDGFKEFKNIDIGNHKSMVKVIWENQNGPQHTIPHLIYVAREKRPKNHHYFKAGAMNVLTRVSGVMTNAPIILNLDCDMFINNPKIILLGMCHLLGFPKDFYSGFVQAPQQFYGALEDDPFGNQLVVLQKIHTKGITGIQGPVYQGTGCFHRRKIIYGAIPENTKKDEKLSYDDIQKVFGNSKALIESTIQIFAEYNTKSYPHNIKGLEEIAKEVSSCTFEHNTYWGREIGWIYGSMTEDILTGLRIHSLGWFSTLLTPDPPAFLGSAPTGGPESMMQYKRWGTGLLEILFSQKNPIIETFRRKLMFRQCFAYLYILVWALRSIFVFSYSLLPAYSLLTNTSFLPKASEDIFILPLALLIFYNSYTLVEYRQCGLSIKSWWNNQRMQIIISVTAWLLSLATVILKILGISETIFEVTQKNQKSSSLDIQEDPRKFTFNSSTMFVLGTAMSLANIIAIIMSLTQLLLQGGQGIVEIQLGEFICSTWVVLSFLPFVKGLFRKEKYGIPWLVIVKAIIYMFIFYRTMCRIL